MLNGQTYLWTVWYRTYLSKDVSPLKNWSRSMTFPIYSINGWWVMMSSVASRPWTMQSKYCYNTITTITTTTTRHINLNFIFIKWQKALTNSNFKMRYRCRAHWVCIYLFQISRSVNLLITVFSEKKFWITYLLSVFIGQRFMVCANKIKTHSGYY